MPITLPVPRQPQTATPGLFVPGGWQSGGGDQFVERPGARWQLDVQLPRLQPEPDGRTLAAALANAHGSGDTVLWPWPQPGLAIGTPGTPLVNGAGQTGRTLNADGFTPGYAVRVGQFVNVITGGRRYLHQIAAAVTANGSGVAALVFTTRLRVPPADNAVIDFNPMIEGRLDGNPASWQLARYGVAPVRFSIVELADEA